MDGVRLTDAGSVLLEESRTVLYLIEHGVRRSRQAAGVDRLRLRFALPPLLPEGLAADTAARLRSVAARPASTSRGWRRRWTPGSRWSASGTPTRPWAG